MTFVLLVLNVSYISLIVSKVPGILMVDVVKELEALRQNLLDLSLRNNLLNYRPSQKRTISITGRKPEEIYELFVLQEKSCGVLHIGCFLAGKAGISQFIQ